MPTSLEKLDWMKTEWEHLKLAETRKGKISHAKRLFKAMQENPEIHVFDIFGNSFFTNSFYVKELARKRA